MQLLQDIHHLFDYALELYCENQYVLKIVKNPIFHARMKHVEYHYHCIKEKVLQRYIEMKYIRTKDQIVDIFIKELNGLKFEEFRT